MRKVLLILIILTLTSCTINNGNSSDLNIIHYDNDMKIEGDLSSSSNKLNLAYIEDGINIPSAMTAKNFVNASSVLLDEKNIIIELMKVTGEDLIMDLLSGDSSFDLLALSSLNPQFVSMYEQGYLVDLKTSDSISLLYEQMLPNIRDLYTYNDIFFGFPVNPPWLSCIKPTEGYELKYDYNTKSIKTMEDIYEFNRYLISTFSEYNYGINFGTHQNFMSIYMINPILLSLNNQTHYADITEFDFDSVLQNKHKLEENKMITGTHYSKEHHFNNKPVVPLVEPLITLPKISDDYNVNISDIDFIAINPYSNNIDTALEAIEVVGEYMKTDMPRSNLYLIYSDIETYSNHNLEAGSLADFMKVNQEDLDNYDEMFKNSQLNVRIEGADDLIKIIEDIYFERISVEEGIVQLQAKIDILSEEYTINMKDD